MKDNRFGAAGYCAIDCTDYCTECDLDKENLICRKHNSKVAQIGDKFLKCTKCQVLSLEKNLDKAVEGFRNMKDNPSSTDIVINKRN